MSISAVKWKIRLIPDGMGHSEKIDIKLTLEDDPSRPNGLKGELTDIIDDTTDLHIPIEDGSCQTVVALNDVEVMSLTITLGDAAAGAKKIFLAGTAFKRPVGGEREFRGAYKIISGGGVFMAESQESTLTSRNTDEASTTTLFVVDPGDTGTGSGSQT